MSRGILPLCLVTCLVSPTSVWSCGLGPAGRWRKLRNLDDTNGGDCLESGASRMRRFATTVALFVMLSAGAWAGEQMALLNFLVVRDYNGKPVRNASVIMHPVKKDGKQHKGGLQLKTDPEGKCSFDGVPYGKLRVQVLAPGFQTFGQDYDIDQPVEEIAIRIKRPQEQYSIYKDNPEEKKEDPAASDKKDDTAPPAAKDSNEKPQ